AAAQQEMGSGPEAATVMALRQFGDPRDLSRQWAREWLEGTASAHGQPPWRAMLVAFVCFGLATLFGSATWLIGPISISDELQGGMGPEWTGGVAVVLPMLVGLATGWLAPARRTLGILYGLAVIIPSVALKLCGHL